VRRSRMIRGKHGRMLSHPECWRPSTFREAMAPYKRYSYKQHHLYKMFTINNLAANSHVNAIDTVRVLFVVYTPKRRYRW
jgi:hypothetical protein